MVILKCFKGYMFQLLKMWEKYVYGIFEMLFFKQCLVYFLEVGLFFESRKIEKFDFLKCVFFDDVELWCLKFIGGVLGVF